MYTLIHPIKSRRNNADSLIEHIAIPEYVTVGMMRKVTGGNEIMRAHKLAEAASALSMFDAAKLHTADALGYANMLAESGMLEPNDEPTMELPTITPVASTFANITAKMEDTLEFAAQLLEQAGKKSGWTRAKIDALDYREFAPCAAILLGSIFDPKS